MAFEPLQTDEPLVGPAPKVRDLDSVLLSGCGTFVFVSIGGYLLAIWPWFAFDHAEQLKVLAMDCAIGLLPAAMLGGIAARKQGLAGACGFIGGGLTIAVFLVLRLQQVFLSARAHQAPEPDFPSTLVWLLPLAWVLVTVLLSLALVSRQELGED